MPNVQNGPPASKKGSSGGLMNTSSPSPTSDTPPDISNHDKKKGTPGGKMLSNDPSPLTSETVPSTSLSLNTSPSISKSSDNQTLNRVITPEEQAGHTDTAPLPEDVSSNLIYS